MLHCISDSPGQHAPPVLAAVVAGGGAAPALVFGVVGRTTFSLPVLGAFPPVVGAAAVDVCVAAVSFTAIDPAIVFVGAVFAVSVVVVVGVASGVASFGLRT